MPFRKSMSFAAMLIVFCGLTAFAEEVSDQYEIIEAGAALAKKYCYKCHAGPKPFNILDPVSLRDTGKLVMEEENKANLDESEVWIRIDNETMPPENAPLRPDQGERETLRQWLALGAPKPVRQIRGFVTEYDVVAAILNDLQTFELRDVPFQRYFMLTHLHNNPKVSELELRLYKAALSKAINSLTWEPDVTIPRAIDAQQTVFRVDLRDLGWDASGIWSQLLKAYPYGLGFDQVEDQAIRRAGQQLRQLSGSPLPYLRGDWFVITATRPPLYHAILEIPETDVELEKRLNVDYARNFDRNRLQRAAFAESGVSTANRMVERHSAATGYYWKSFDFAPGSRRSNLFQYPLGPTFPENPYNEFAFSHDGGEQIFGLPNGMQGYMLLDAKGNRISEGPIAVVRDRTETSGTVTVVNGISCMHCHKVGMIDFKDTVRQGMALAGDVRLKVLDLYPPEESMDRLVEKDRERHLAALEEVIGPFLMVEEDKDQPIEYFEEPIGKIAALYHHDLDLTDVACELFVEDALSLGSLIKNSRELKRLGLGPLANGGGIQRSAWQSRENVTTPCQNAAMVLDRGTPLIFQ